MIMDLIFNIGFFDTHFISDMPTLPFPTGDCQIGSLIYLPHAFQYLVETLDFLDTYTKIFKMAYNLI